MFRIALNLLRELKIFHAFRFFGSPSTTNAASLPAAVINGILQSDNNEIMLVKLLGHFWALQVSSDLHVFHVCSIICSFHSW